jgi:hypothetical protein
MIDPAVSLESIKKWVRSDLDPFRISRTLRSPERRTQQDCNFFERVEADPFELVVAELMSYRWPAPTLSDSHCRRP